ncbi:MAG: peroxiredoxin-like family protein [Candidatus Binatia bacterium]
MQLQAYQRRLPEMQALGASLVAITPEKPDNSLSTAEKNALAFDVCSDVDQSVAQSYGLVFQLYEELKPIYRAIAKDLTEWNASGTWELPIPATYVIDRDRRIRLAYVDANYATRLEPEAILDSLRRIRGA